MKNQRTTVYSALVLFDDHTWEDRTYEVPAGMTEDEVVRAIEGESRKIMHVACVSPDPDAPEGVARSLECDHCSAELPSAYGDPEAQA